MRRQENNSPQVSIITINLNNGNELENTLLSVHNQTYKNFEYIIIDGGSSDNSLNVITTNSDKITLYISEPDNGIYDAMNKGIRMAKGSWLLFLNAGDLLCDNLVLENIFSRLVIKDYDILYGGVKLKCKDDYEIVMPSELCSFFYKMPFCHQSSFVKNDILKEKEFNQNYKIAADYDFFCQMYRERKKFKKINLCVSVFADGGVSSINKKQMYDEFKTISNTWFNGFFRKKMYICYKYFVLLRKLKIK